MRRSVFLVLIKRKRLNNFQLKELSKFFFNATLLAWGSLILKFFEPEAKISLDRRILFVLILAILVSIVLFRVGLLYSSKVKEK